MANRCCLGNFQAVGFFYWSFFGHWVVRIIPQVTSHYLRSRATANDIYFKWWTNYIVRDTIQNSGPLNILVDYFLFCLIRDSYYPPTVTDLSSIPGNPSSTTRMSMRPREAPVSCFFSPGPIWCSHLQPVAEPPRKVGIFSFRFLFAYFFLVWKSW